MRADGTGTMRLIHEEETTWKARPDWSSDGRRVVYSSYAGRQRNQLWLMTSDGENPFQLTYGDWDATAPRWSPDTKRIAYISNETGNTSLWIVEVPGGARTRVEARTLRWREPVGALTVLVTDAATGRLVDARVSVTGADSRAWAPRDALRRADDSFDRRERAYEVGYFHTSGRAELTVPEGEYTLEVTHGPEYRVERRTVRVSARAARTVRVAVRRLIDLPRLGWWSGDLHVHMNYGGAYKVEPSGLASQARAEDLHEVEDLIVNKEQRFPDIAYFRGASPDPVSTPRTLIVHSQEYHTSYWGHTALLGLEDHLVLPGYAAYQHTAAASLYPANANVFDMGHAQGALTGYVHPFDSAPDPADTTQSLTDELPVDVALGKTDYMEILGFSDHRATADVWYRLLNCGFRLPAGAGTDAMSNFASLRGPVGLNRVYVRTGATLDHTKWMDGIRAGRTFATNGPLLRLTVNGKEPGADIALPLGRHTLTVKVELYSNVPVDHLELVRNGNVVDSIPLSDDRMSAVATRTITVNKSAWVTLRAWSDHAEPPILDAYPFATTSPVYVTVAGLPVRSPDDARYFMAWVDRLREDALASTDWNTEEERRAVLDLIARARAEFEKRSYEQSVMAPR
jgi:hypothetical protein